MNESSETATLLARWRAGDEQAATALFQRYAERLIALAQRHLSARLAARIDAEDVVQSVYGSFFVAARNHRYVVEQRGDLWRLLVGITLHKLHRQVEYHSAGKRDVSREFAWKADGSQPSFPAEALAKEPTPIDAVALADTVETVLRGLDPLQRRMVELRLQGHSLGEIVQQTQRSWPTVSRVLERVADKLRQEG